MPSITVTMKNGTKREFPHCGRPDSLWTKTLTFEGAFAVITDEYQARTAIPAADIAEIIEIPNRW